MPGTGYENLNLPINAAGRTARETSPAREPLADSAHGTNRMTTRIVVAGIAAVVLVVVAVCATLVAAKSFPDKWAAGMLAPSTTTSTSTVTSTTTTLTTSSITTSTSTRTTSTVTTTEACPACSPEEVDVPDVVIPFFERDVCKAKYLAKSLAVHDPKKRLGTIFLMWVSMHSASEYEAPLAEINESIGDSHDVRFIDFSQSMKDQDISGWFAQQIVKLKVASEVKSKYYIVLDAKNTLLRDVEADTFFTRCNQGKMIGIYSAADIPEPHISWYKASAAALRVPPPAEGQWPSSVTPVVIHKPTVLSMLESIEEGSSINKFCDGPLCEMFGAKSEDGKGATEFTMYTLFARNASEFECHQAVRTSIQWDLSHRWAASLWRGVGDNKDKMAFYNLDRVKKIATKEMVPLMFGSQPGALGGMNESTKANATEYLVTIYKDAGLHDPNSTTTEDLISCAIGVRMQDLPTTVTTTTTSPAFCCQAAQDQGNFCNTCYDNSRVSRTDYCGESSERCSGCGGQWCQR